MDSVTIIIGAVVTALCVLPFIIISRNKKRREKQFLQSLSNIAEKQNCKITLHEFFGDFVIGLDEKANFFFFYKKMDQIEITEHINLAEIQKCKIVTTARTVGEKKDSYTVTDKLELSFLSGDKSIPNKTIEFYNSQESMQLTGELQLLEKWAKIVDDRINPSQNRK